MFGPGRECLEVNDLLAQMATGIIKSHIVSLPHMFNGDAYSSGSAQKQLMCEYVLCVDREVQRKVSEV